MTVIHDEARQRYLIRLPEGEAELAYRRVAPHLLDLYHTHVPESRRGAGLGAQLVAGALAQIRARGEKVLPGCPFVRRYMELHPEAIDLMGTRVAE